MPIDCKHSQRLSHVPLFPHLYPSNLSETEYLPLAGSRLADCYLRTLHARHWSGNLVLNSGNEEEFGAYLEQTEHIRAESATIQIQMLRIPGLEQIHSRRNMS